MHALFLAHSIIRYVVLGAGGLGFIALVVAALGRRPASTVARSVGGAFVGTIDLQALVGIALVALRGSPMYRPIWIHVGLMLSAAVLAHVCFALNRKRATPGYALPLFGVVGALVLIVAGILALGRPVIGG